LRLKDKIAIAVGAGQSPGEGLGNGRATVLRFAQEGAKVLTATVRDRTVRKIAAELAARGHVAGSGKPHAASAVQKMVNAGN
jgi:NAD(P)-dependent dehydrogenase (short-subunit alcohol dehydrogenase family)